MLAHPVLNEIAASHGRSPSQVALHWLTRPSIVPVVKTRRPTHRAENLALGCFKFRDDQLDERLIGRGPATVRWPCR
ncbi:MAG: aldo/keto reductase [Novosphingobium sp.]